MLLTKRDRCWLRKKSSQGRLHHFLLFSDHLLKPGHLFLLPSQSCPHLDFHTAQPLHLLLKPFHLVQSLHLLFTFLLFSTYIFLLPPSRSGPHLDFHTAQPLHLLLKPF